jgi:hypothetical protein
MLMGKTSMKMKTVIALLVATAFVAPAQAATSIWTGSGATDTLSWVQLGPPSFTQVTTGSKATSVGGIVATISSSNETNFERLDQNNGWSGNFAPGTPLLWNENNAGDMNISFATNTVFGVGAQFQTSSFGPFTARITTNDGSFFDVPGTSNSTGNNSAVFIGAQSDTSSISSIVFHEVSDSGSNDFAISGLSFLTGSVSAAPEPATWGMMIVGFGMAGASMRRRRQNVRTTYA